MTERAAPAARSDRLAAALRLFQTREEDWAGGELPDLLEAQLALPAPPAGGRTWRDGLLNPPSLEAIIALKDIAKGWIGGQPALPAEIARLLYITAIASAQTRFGTAISQLPATQLDWHRTWALSQIWADSALLDVIRGWQIDAGG